MRGRAPGVDAGEVYGACCGSSATGRRAKRGKWLVCIRPAAHSATARAVTRLPVLRQAAASAAEAEHRAALLTSFFVSTTQEEAPLLPRGSSRAATTASGGLEKAQLAERLGKMSWRQNAATAPAAGYAWKRGNEHAAAACVTVCTSQRLPLRLAKPHWLGSR